MEIYNWGSSLYGGYYANYWIDETHMKCRHFDKLKDLRKWCKENGMSLPNYKRHDSI